MNIIQRINLANNENGRNKIINVLFSFFEISIIIFFFVIIIRNISIKNLNNKNKFIREHRFLNIEYDGPEIINDIFSEFLLDNMNLSIDRNSEEEEKYFNNYENNSTFNLNNEEHLFKALLLCTRNNYIGKLESLYYHKNNSNIDIRNATILKLFSYESDNVYISLNKAKDNFNRQTFLVIDLRNYITNIRYVLYANISELNKKYNIINKRFIVKRFFSGVLFDSIIDNKINLSAFVELEFKTENFNNKTYMYRYGFTLLLLIPDYGLNLKINSQIEMNQKKYNEKPKIQDNDLLGFYFYVLSIIFFIPNVIGVRCLIRNIENKESLISAISLESFSLNFICHLFISILHAIFFFYTKFVLFGVTAFCSFINFFFNDCVFINLFWRLKLRGLTCFQGFKSKLRFFIINSSFFLFLHPSTIKLFIFYFSFMIWSPQILHNIVNNNEYIYPFFYIFFTTLEKAIYLFLLIKMYPISLKVNKYMIIISFTYLSISVVILYLQTFLGPRFMLPSRCNKKESIYISYKELLKDKSKSKLYKEICAICLSNISDFGKKEKKNNKNKISNKNKNKYDNITKNFNYPMNANNGYNNSITTIRVDLVSSRDSQSDNNNIINTSQYLRVIRNSIKCFINTLGKLGPNLKNILSECLFSFYIIKKNSKNKEIMLLPCNHIFHSICLNEWIKKKMKCPLCSRTIPI